MSLIGHLKSLFGFTQNEVDVTIPPPTDKTRLERYMEEYEFYKNKDNGYRSNNDGMYNITKAKQITVHTFTRNVHDMLKCAEAINDALSDRGNRKALRLIADKIKPKSKAKLVDFMMTDGGYYAYPDALMGEIVNRQFERLLKTMEELEESEKEGRYAFFIRFTDPLLEDCLTLFKVLKDNFE